MPIPGYRFIDQNDVAEMKAAKVENEGKGP